MSYELEQVRREYNAATANGLILRAADIKRRLDALSREQGIDDDNA